MFEKKNQLEENMKNETYITCIFFIVLFTHMYMTYLFSVILQIQIT